MRKRQGFSVRRPGKIGNVKSTRSKSFNFSLSRGIGFNGYDIQVRIFVCIHNFHIAFFLSVFFFFFSKRITHCERDLLSIGRPGKLAYTILLIGHLLSFASFQRKNVELSAVTSPGRSECQPSAVG